MMRKAVGLWLFTGGLALVAATSASGAPACPLTPATGCADAATAKVKLERPTAADESFFLWTWSGTATRGQFGDPLTATSYQLCAYEDGELVSSPLLLESGEWTAGKTGFAYKAGAEATDGIRQVKLREGLGKAKIRVRGSGSLLAGPAIPLEAASTITIQLMKDGTSGGECWQSVFAPPDLGRDGVSWSDLEKTGPSVRSAFFGLDDALPEVVNVICPGGAGMDGMPVVFTRELAGYTIQAADFVVTTAGGASKTPHCATPLPSGESNENRTVLLVGDFGDAIADPPARIEIVGSLQTEPDSKGRSAELQGTAFAPVTPLEAGPFLVFAERMDGVERELGNPGGIGVGAGCPVDGTEQVVKVVWAGGVRALSGDELGDAERVRYSVILEDGSEIVPFALADLDDQDNNHDLCLDDARRPIRVEMLPDTVIDPRGDANPATGVEVRVP